MKRLLLVLGVTVLFALPGEAFAQFRQFGHFGKNKVIYKNFDWQIYKAPHFDIYYYPEEAQFLEQMVSYAESAYLELTDALDHEPTFRIPLIYYRTHGDFEQTNITLSFLGEGVGAFAEPSENRMVLPIDVPPDSLYKLVKHELVHIFEYSILYQGSGARAFRGRPPGWLMEGLASFLAKDENNLDQMFIRDAVVNGILPPITRVRSRAFWVYRYGHATFDFIESEYGPEGIRTFLSEFRKILLTGNIGKAIKESFGIEAEEFDRKFHRYLRKKYVPILLENNEPEDHGREIGVKLPGVYTISPSLSPSGDLVAVMTTKSGFEFDVAIINARDGKMIRNLTKGLTSEYDQLTARFYEGKNDLSWSPGGDEVAVFARKDNKRLLLLFNAVTGKQVLKARMDVEDAESPAFSPDGERIAFVGNKDGQVDIFEYNLKTKELSNITNDIFYDANPSWSSDGSTILYNRRINSYEKVFLLDYNDPAQKTQVTFGETSDIQPSFSRDGNRIYYSSDAGPNGIFNIYSLDLETGEVRQYTDVISGHFSPQELSFEEGERTLVSTAYWRIRYRLYKVDLEEPVAVIKPEERVQEPEEIAPFESALKLTVDEDQKSSYDKKKFHLETTPAVAVGVASDGTVYGNALLIFSDLLGDHRIWVNVQSVSSFSNFDVGYINMKKRLQWFARGRDYRDFVVFFSDSGSTFREQSNRISELSGGLIYPTSTSTRITLESGVQNRDVIGSDVEPLEDPNGNEFAFFTSDSEAGTSPFVRFKLINDTVRFKGFGPWHGKALNLTLATFPYATGDIGAYNFYSLDFRAYHKMTRRSLVAWRVIGLMGTGDGAPFFSIGGINQLRGFEYREFIGDQAAFSNFELRFPVIDELRFPFGALREIRSWLFFDMGAAWTQDGLWFDRELGFFREFEPYNSDENALQDFRASYGFGFSVRLGFFNLIWNFTKRIPFYETRASSKCDSSYQTPGLTLRELAALALQNCDMDEVKDSGFRSDFYIGFPF